MNNGGCDEVLLNLLRYTIHDLMENAERFILNPESIPVVNAYNFESFNSKLAPMKIKIQPWLNCWQSILRKFLKVKTSVTG